MSFSDGFNSTFRSLDNAYKWRSAQEESARQFDETLGETKRVNDSRIRNFQALTARTQEMTKGLKQDYDFNERTEDNRANAIAANTRSAVATADSNEAIARSNDVVANLAERTEGSRGDAQIAALREQASASELNTLLNDGNKAATLYSQIDNSLKDKSPQELTAFLADPANTEVLQTSVFMASLDEGVSGAGFGPEDGASLMPVVDDDTGQIIGFSGVRVGPRDVSKTQKTDADGEPVFAVDDQGNPILDAEGNRVPEDDFTPVEEFAQEYQGFIQQQASLADRVGQGGQQREARRALGQGSQPQAQTQQQPQGLRAAEPAPELIGPEIPDDELVARSRELEQQAAELEKEITQSGAAPEPEPQDTFLGRAGRIQQGLNARTGERSRNATTLGQGFGAGAANTWDAAGSIGNHVWNGVRSLAGEVTDGMTGAPAPEQPPRKATPEQEARRAQIQREARAVQQQMKARSQPAQQQGQQQQRSLGSPAAAGGDDFLARVETMEEAMGRPMTGIELENFKFTGSIQATPEKLAESTAKRTKAAQKQLTGFLKEIGTLGAVSAGVDKHGRPTGVKNEEAGQAVQLQMEGLLNTNPTFRQIYNTPGGSTYLKVMTNRAAQRAEASGAAPNLMAELTLGIESASARDAGQVLAHMIPQLSEDREIDDATYTRMAQAVNEVLQARPNPTDPVSADEAESLAGKAMRDLRQ